MTLFADAIESCLDLLWCERGKLFATAGEDEREIGFAGAAALAAAGFELDLFERQAVIASEAEDLFERNVVADAAVDGHG